MKDVVISMESIQGYDLDHSDTVSFITDGYYFQDGDSSCFSYMETEVTGLAGTRTSVIVRPGEVVVDRDGSITSRMVFRQGMKNSFQYATPYGMATLNVSTRKINQRFDERGGELEVDYAVDMEHSMVMRNKMKLKITEQREDIYYG